MTARQNPTLVVTEDLPVYPLPHDFRMPTHYFTAWWHNRWLNSDLHLTGDYEVQGVAVALYSIAQNQSPLGTLPQNEVLIARMLRLDPIKWQNLCRLAISPLHGWYLANCEGVVRWAHPVVLEMLLDARDRADTRRMSNEDRAVQKRIERLRKALAEIGVDKGILADRVAMEAMDEWLEVNWKKRRNALALGRVLQWASGAGIFTGAKNIKGLR
jgi:hypothetical protein